MARAALRLTLVSLLAQLGAGCGGAGVGAGAGAPGTLSKPSGRRPAAGTLSKPSGRRPAARAPGVLFADVLAVPAGVADPGRTRIYIADSEGVKAVGVARGEVLWSSDAAIRPLIASKDRVVAIGGRVPGSDAAHSLVVLDPRDGRVIATLSLPIPSRWGAPRPARLEGRRFVLAWGESRPVVRRICSGMYREPPKPTPFTPRSGVATVDLESGAVDIGEGLDEAPPPGVTGDLVPFARGGAPKVWRTDAGFAAVMPGDEPGALVVRTWDVAGGHGTSHPLGAPPPGGALYVRSYGAHVIINRMDSPSGPGQITIHGLDDGRRIAALPPDTACASPVALVGGRILCTATGSAALPEGTKPVARKKWGTILTPRAVVAYDRASGDRVWLRPIAPSSRYVCPPLP